MLRALIFSLYPLCLGLVTSTVSNPEQHNSIFLPSNPPREMRR